MTTPISEPLLTVPFVSVPEFRASPTWLDTEDLIQGGTGPQQDSELYNVLLRASSWANNCVRQPLQAHHASDFTQARVDKRGRIFVHPKNIPVRQITGFAYGSDFKNLTTVTDLTNIWVEDQRGIVVANDVMSGIWAGSLQFGSVPAFDQQIYVYYEYIAGYGNAQITANAASGQSQVTVDNALGFQGPSTSFLGSSIGASVARIWDPGLEEAVTVQSVTGSVLTLSSNLTNTHAVGTDTALNVQVSEFPAEIRQAVVCYAVGLLLRQDTGQDEPFAGSVGPTARMSGRGGLSGGLVSEAERLISPYKRVR